MVVIYYLFKTETSYFLVKLYKMYMNNVHPDNLLTEPREVTVIHLYFVYRYTLSFKSVINISQFN